MKRLCFFLVSWMAVLLPLVAQDQPSVWTLQACIDYAHAHNIQIQKSRINLESQAEETLLAKAQLFPSLSASVTQGFVGHPSQEVASRTSYTGNYSLNVGWTLFDGGKRTQAIRQSKQQEQIDQLSITQSQDDIDKSLIRCYMQLLYAMESVRVNQNSEEVSWAQLERSRGLLQAGSISQTDFAQMESQHSSDKYQLVVAQTAVSNYKLQLKQLLELDISDEIEIYEPQYTQTEVLTVLPSKEQIYASALALMPEVEMSRLGVEIALLEKKRAQAGYYPTLSLNAGVGTGHLSGSDYLFGSQLWNSFNTSVGLSLSIPLYSNRSNKTAVRKSSLAIQTAQLEWMDTQKNLLKEVEESYLEATSAQNQYVAAIDQERAARSSYQLVEEQYFLGMKNAVDLLVEKNSFLSAQQQLLQAKYTTILNLSLLNLYQRKSIVIPSVQ